MAWSFFMRPRTSRTSDAPLLSPTYGPGDMSPQSLKSGELRPQLKPLKLLSSRYQSANDANLTSTPTRPVRARPTTWHLYTPPPYLKLGDADVTDAHPVSTTRGSERPSTFSSPPTRSAPRGIVLAARQPTTEGISVGDMAPVRTRVRSATIAHSPSRVPVLQAALVADTIPKNSSMLSAVSEDVKAKISRAADPNAALPKTEAGGALRWAGQDGQALAIKSDSPNIPTQDSITDYLRNRLDDNEAWDVLFECDDEFDDTDSEGVSTSGPDEASIDNATLVTEVDVTEADATEADVTGTEADSSMTIDVDANSAGKGTVLVASLNQEQQSSEACGVDLEEPDVIGTSDDAVVGGATPVTAIPFPEQGLSEIPDLGVTDLGVKPNGNLEYGKTLITACPTPGQDVMDGAKLDGKRTPCA
ncbi:hypothetical protein OBBRIDRAFT_277345 [Obba rivulosa]|uniref:Uncharacterized protein n=1 Tax=Obba rivulosa TaxID=1052685 RepID=A0A8E2DQ25_9APHY|nr:hypothetical protein OBBRIDRAFT_277345 [Obba rivulosa]